MTTATLTTTEQSADFSLPAGCLLCGGAFNVRLTPGAAWGYCPQCHWLSHPEVWVESGTLRLSHDVPTLS